MTQRLVWNFEFSTKKSLSLSNRVNESDRLKWEIRFFWPEDQIISLHILDNSLLDIAHYQQKHKEDYYYLLPDCLYNIKRRRNEMLYKPALKHATHAIGYGAKINLEAVEDYPVQEPATVLKLQNILRMTQEKGIEVCVKKESFTYKFATTPSVKLELARLEVNNKVYFSLCVEGRSLYLVETISEHLLDKPVSCDYVTFLKSIIKS
ncbi:hypothetical protein [Legionella maioricensis]|uniref:Uncharacterized protein n=1 Tax=Legionella maioricensis TaxID=2896528 RepID=A0A9X2D2Q1_9GAMM|nr:hypothetical protein [Legionella maioricensis]MCL9685157.1 hypothetical protein [Legionella maioricensis]MCL9688330.1 hypothetical protein [Legionella maioricensis]